MAESGESGGEYAVELVGITKRFPGVVANDDINLRVRRGEVHALCGENGAGKSTLMKILYGMQHPDEGAIRVNGAEVHFRSPADAIKAGIGMVHQHFMLADNFTVAENVLLGAEAEHGIGAAARARIAELAGVVGLKAEPGLLVEQLGVGGPAARRDRQGALPRCAHGDPGRAHRRACTAGGRRAVRHPARHARRGLHVPVHLPQVGRGAGHRRHDHRDPPGDVRRHRGPAHRHQPGAGRDDGGQRAAGPGQPRVHRDGPRGAARRRAVTRGRGGAQAAAVGRGPGRARRRGARHCRGRGQRTDRAG